MQISPKTSFVNEVEFSAYGIVKVENFLKILLKLFLILPKHNQSRDENQIFREPQEDTSASFIIN